MEDVIFHYYEVLGNKDQTEGRGGYIVKRTYQTEGKAIWWAQTREGQGQCGVMGHGYGQVDRIDIIDEGADNGQLVVKRTTIWGHRKNWTDKWDHGYVDLRDAPVNDPDYAEYVRLKGKFGG